MTANHTHRSSGFASRAFARPQGMLGRIGGLLMAKGNAPAQHEVAGLLTIRPGDRVLEVGYGPGTLLRLLADESDAKLIAGVDPSPVMRDFALRRCRAAVAAGRVEPRIGTATETGFADESFDHVVSVNNIPFWGDIPAGLRELHRVLRPGGTLVVAFHSRSSPSRRQRRIGLPEDAARRVEAAMAGIFGEVERHDLEHVVAFTAVR